MLDRGLEVLDADLMLARQSVDAACPGDVEQHAAGDHGAEEMDAEPSGAQLVDLVGPVAVVQVAIDADVSKAIEVGGALHREGDEILAESWAIGSHVFGHVDAGHGQAGVLATFDEAHLDAVSCRERQAQRERLSSDHRCHRPQSRCCVDQVERPAHVVVTPASPIADSGSHGVEGGRGHGSMRLAVGGIGGGAIR